MTKTTILTSKDYISTREAANKYNYCLRNIRDWARSRKIKAVKHSRKWYVHEPSLKAWINSLG